MFDIDSSSIKCYSGIACMYVYILKKKNGKLLMCLNICFLSLALPRQGLSERELDSWYNKFINR